MFSDPQSITVNAVAQSLPAIARNGATSEYMTADGGYKLTVGHQYKPERNRYTVRIDFTKIAADPLASANNRVYSGAVYMVLDKPVVGYTSTEVKDIALALAGWCTSANLLKVLGGET